MTAEDGVVHLRVRVCDHLNVSDEIHRVKNLFLSCSLVLAFFFKFLSFFDFASFRLLVAHRVFLHIFFWLFLPLVRRLVSRARLFPCARPNFLVFFLNILCRHLKFFFVFFLEQVCHLAFVLLHNYPDVCAD